MSKEETLKSYLATLTGKSVFALEKPQGNKDCIVYKRVSTKTFRKLAGNTGIAKERFQLEIYAERYSDVRTTANLILSNMDGNTTNFLCSVVENNIDLKDIENGLYWSVIDVFIY
jgi:hypothetical protein